MMFSSFVPPPFPKPTLVPLMLPDSKVTLFTLITIMDGAKYFLFIINLFLVIIFFVIVPNVTTAAVACNDAVLIGSFVTETYTVGAIDTPDAAANQLVRSNLLNNDSWFLILLFHICSLLFYHHLLTIFNVKALGRMIHAASLQVKVFTI